MADKGYDSDEIVRTVQAQNMQAHCRCRQSPLLGHVAENFVITQPRRLVEKLGSELLAAE